MNKDKNRIIAETWFLVDFCLFNDDPKKIFRENTDKLKEYWVIKTSFLKNLYEMYDVLGYNNQEQYYNGKNQFFDYMEDIVKSSLDEVCEYMEKDNVMIELKEEFDLIYDDKLDKNNAVQNFIENKKYAFLLDDVLINRSISECTQYKIEDAWRFKILNTTYKKLRNELIECALKR